ncbi:glycosyltransferase family 2 protein [Evansella clarkii]|jgi:glycosyltransferase involved in cell wall biosynthesis|uniref:glycosyltransferase family 2 protein n=1 Tax=Evansella clarkii TaxID=79879 RepID=UPI000997FBCD|nr:glycosyltransferase family 2 protein [Evansella clarkii]
MITADIIIPAYNEADRLYETLNSLREEKWVNQIVVIDDGSTDRTAEIAREKADLVHSLPDNKGKSAAVFTGLNFIEGEWVVLLDADLGATAREAEKLLFPLMVKKADMTSAVFPPASKSGFGMVKKRAVNIIRKHTGIQLLAPLSGQRAFHRNWIPFILSGNGRGYGLEIYLNLLFLKHGGVIKEVNTLMNHRATGKDFRGICHRARQWLEMELTTWNY